MFYYLSDGTKFISKIDALEYSRYKNIPVHFYYYDDIYSKLDWTKEPIYSLDHYYLEQAKRIRYSYDYLILLYSGGYDSTNILETFYYNRLKLDKIVTVGAFEQDTFKFSDENHNGEVYYNVIPYIKELGLESIFHRIDYSKLFHDTSNFSIINQKTHWTDLCGSWFSPHNWFWYDIEKFVVPSEWKNKKVGIIFGKDKPTLFYSPMGKVYNNKIELNGFFFRDTPVTGYASTKLVRERYDNIKRIDFYWDPEFPDILLKQLHTLYKYYLKKRSNTYIAKEGTQKLGGTSVNDLVYKLHSKILFKSPKSPSNFLSLRDSFLLTKTNNDISINHSSGIERIKNRLNTQEITTIPPVFSRFYSLI